MSTVKKAFAFVDLYKSLSLHFLPSLFVCVQRMCMCMWMCASECMWQTVYDDKGTEALLIRFTSNWHNGKEMLNLDNERMGEREREGEQSRQW